MLPLPQVPTVSGVLQLHKGCKIEEFNIYQPASGCCSGFYSKETQKSWLFVCFLIQLLPTFLAVCASPLLQLHAATVCPLMAPIIEINEQAGSQISVGSRCWCGSTVPWASHSTGLHMGRWLAGLTGRLHGITSGISHTHAGLI